MFNGCDAKFDNLLNLKMLKWPSKSNKAMNTDDDDDYDDNYNES